MYFHLRMQCTCVIFGIIIMSFYIILRYHGSIHSYSNNGKYQVTMHAQGKVRSPPYNRIQYCLTNTYLKKRQRLPGPCDDSMLVLDCPNPYLEYLHDPEVLNTCGVRNDSKLPKRKKQITKGSSMTDCPKKDEILISNSSLPISPKPQQTPGKVPKIVHYVTLGCKRIFTFAQHLSVLSVHRFIKPGRIYFHGDCTAKGPWWQRTTNTIPNMYFRKWSRIKLIQGKHPRWVEHETDIIRLQGLSGKIHQSLIGRTVVSSLSRIISLIALYYYHK